MDADPSLVRRTAGFISKIGSTWEGTAVVLRLPPTGQTDKAVLRDRAAVTASSDCLLISISPFSPELNHVSTTTNLTMMSAKKIKDWLCSKPPSAQ